MERVISRELPLCKSRLAIKMENVGEDIVLIVRGGTREHIGCAVLAVPRPSLTGTGFSSTASVLNVTGHKDEAICRLLAERLSAATNQTVFCCGGFHLDQITPEQINEVIRSAQEIADELVADG